MKTVDLMHYGSALVLLGLGVVGSLGVVLPGVTIDPATCFTAAVGVFAAGLKGGITA